VFRRKSVFAVLAFFVYIVISCFKSKRTVNIVIMAIHMPH